MNELSKSITLMTNIWSKDPILLQPLIANLRVWKRKHPKITISALFCDLICKNPQSKIFSIMHYKTIVKMHYFKKNLLNFSNGHIHLILGPILKTWVPFIYSLEHKEFENLFIVFVF